MLTNVLPSFYGSQFRPTYYVCALRRHRRHKSRKKRCHMPEMTASLYKNGCVEMKYDVRF